jgi:3-oxoacyl-[acyl-carrier-protein] synthase III
VPIHRICESAVGRFGLSQCILNNIAIRGVVGALPGEPLSIKDVRSTLTVEEIDKVSSTVGLRDLYRTTDLQTSGDLCIVAARRLLEALKWDPGSIDGIFVVTQTPDHFLPATAFIAHRELKLGDHCVAFDIGLGCSGYVFGLWTAAQFIASGSCKRILLLAGDTISKLISPGDKSVAVLFGDAGSATALEIDASAGPMAFVGGSEGAGAENLCVPGGAFRVMPCSEVFAQHTDELGNTRSQRDLAMDGLAIFNFTLQRVPPLVNTVTELRGWRVGEVDLFVFHQANGFMLKSITKKLKLRDEQAPINIGKFGNTSMASMPLLMADSAANRLRSPEPAKVVVVGFGVGYSWGALATEMSSLITDIVHLSNESICSTRSISAGS